jgi:hypothetical protein
MIKKYKFYASTGYVGCEREETVEIEIDDDATQKEIEEVVEEEFKEWMCSNIDSGYCEVD